MTNGNIGAFLQAMRSGKGERKKGKADVRSGPSEWAGRIPPSRSAGGTG